MRIVITGAGIVSAIGLNKKQTLISLQQELTGIVQRSPFFPAGGNIPVGAVQADNAQLKQQLCIPQEQLVSRTSLLGIHAAEEALRDAHLTNREYGKVSFLNGTTVGGMDLTEHYYAHWQQGIHTDTALLHDAGASTDAIAAYFGGFAYHTTLSTACSSALNAIIAGADMLLSGKAEYVLAGGTESLTRFHFEGFRSLMITDDKPCRPFCATRTGLNLGEGAAYVVLETEESALRRGIQPLAWLSGYGNTCDAYHQTASSENGEGAYLAMRQALETADIAPADIDYINAHGTGTPNNDASETTAFRRLFGANVPPFSSTKAFTGHTTSASGSIETVICLLALHSGFIPANLNWQHAIPDGIIPVVHSVQQPLRHILCNAFGFGGNCTSVVLSSEAGKELPCPSGNISWSIIGEVTVTDETEAKQWLTPMECRRLTPAMKKTLAAACKALHEAGIAKPDAVITGTSLGCIRNSRRLLDALCLTRGEVSPTLFMQSTHNTVSSLIAIRLHAHGYNCTYSQGERSFNDAMQDAVTQIIAGKVENALVIGFDETDETWSKLLRSLGKDMNEVVRACIITNNKSKP